MSRRTPMAEGRDPKARGSAGSNPAAGTPSPVCPDCGPLDYNEVLGGGERLFCGLCGEDLPNVDNDVAGDQEEAMSEWRTGRHPTDEPGPRQRTIYGPDGELRGVMFTTEDARLVVGALNGLAAAQEENGRLREALVHALDRYECDFANEENDTDCGYCTRCLMRAALGPDDGAGFSEEREIERQRLIDERGRRSDADRWHGR